MDAKEFIARRTVKFFSDGDLVNLGIGLPSMVANYVPRDLDVWFTTENGAIGICGLSDSEGGDANLVNASGSPVDMRQGGCCFDSFTSFGLIRGGHVAFTVLGAYEVDQEGNLANWTVPGRTTAGIGGAMDLVSGAQQVLVTTTHTNKDGKPKILKKCTLPLTAAHKVNYIITELCVMKVTSKGLVLQELAPGITVDEVRSKTGAELLIPDVINCMTAEIGS